jgi:hypothetical protein
MSGHDDAAKDGKREMIGNFELGGFVWYTTNPEGA